MTKSIMKYAARCGLTLGLVLAVMFLCAAYSLAYPVLSIVCIGMFLGVPVLIYVWLRNTYRRYACALQFSALWMQGIAIFFFGCLIMSAVMYVYMRYIRPDFIIEQLRQASELYSSVGAQGEQLSDTINTMLDKHLIPKPIDVAVQFIWLGVFSGSILSMIISFIVRKTTH